MLSKLRLWYFLGNSSEFQRVTGKIWWKRDFLTPPPSREIVDFLSLAIFTWSLLVYTRIVVFSSLSRHFEQYLIQVSFHGCHYAWLSVLLLCSGKDHLIPSPEEGERLRHMLPNCEIRRFNNSGHALLLVGCSSFPNPFRPNSFFQPPQMTSVLYHTQNC